jgi:GNAT superfamily N-acetyltransferase
MAADSSQPLQIHSEASDGAAGSALLAAFAHEIATLYPGWHPGIGPSAAPAELRPPRGAFLVAYRHGRAIGCGALKRLDARSAEVKRLFVARAERGGGVARAILDQLEATARAAGYATLRLDTGDRQPHALALFRAAGYREIEDYNNNPAARHWLEKELADGA